MLIFSIIKISNAYMLEQGMRRNQIREPSQDYQNVEIMATMILYGP